MELLGFYKGYLLGLLLGFCTIVLQHNRVSTAYTGMRSGCLEAHCSGMVGIHLLTVDALNVSHGAAPPAIS